MILNRPLGTTVYRRHGSVNERVPGAGRRLGKEEKDGRREAGGPVSIAS